MSNAKSVGGSGVAVRVVGGALCPRWASVSTPTPSPVCETGNHLKPAGHKAPPTGKPNPKQG